MRAFIVLLIAAAVAFGFYTANTAEALALLPALQHLLHGDHLVCAVPLLAGYLSEEQLGEQLGVTRRTLWRWRKLRQGPPVTYVGGSPKYRIQAVEQWLLSREVRPVRERSRARRTAVTS